MTPNFVVVVNVLMRIYCHIGSGMPYLHMLSNILLWKKSKNCDGNVDCICFSNRTGNIQHGGLYDSLEVGVEAD